MTQASPIALFAFNRPEHTQATLDALRENELARESELTIFCDGPRSAEDEAGVGSHARPRASNESMWWNERKISGSPAR